MKLRTRILLVALAFVALIIVPAGFLSWRFTAGALESQLYAALDEESGLVLALLRSTAERGDEGMIAAEVVRLGRLMDRHITIVGGGRVFDSDPGATERSAGGEEIDRAMRAAVGRSRRVPEGDETEWAFVARRIPPGLPPPLQSGVIRIGATAEGVVREEVTARNLLLALGMFLFGIAALVSVPIAGWISRRITGMEKTARSIAAGAVLERAAVTSHDELGALAGALNTMAEKLHSDIARLEKLERVRSEFLGNVSHELRTPIFSIQGFLETLLDGAVDDPAVNRDFLEKAHTQAGRLNALLRDLIEISRIESGEMKMSFRYFTLEPFLEQMVEEMKDESGGKNLSIVRIPGMENLEVYGDRERLRQVMTNLIDNALKYTDAGGSVTLRYAPLDESCAISVTDTGRGIPAEHIPRIFERFYRVDRDRSREVGGTGLGLSIVKHIVEAHGGTVRVESTVGKGSTFTFTLKR
jgi:two-component system, OmpR family, phosphate regulon sensor histidine kinase PhoR